MSWWSRAWNSWASWENDSQDAQWTHVQEAQVTTVVETAGLRSPIGSVAVDQLAINPATGVTYKNSGNAELQEKKNLEKSLEQRSADVAIEMGIPKEMVVQAQQQVLQMLDKPTKGRCHPCVNCGDNFYKSELMPLCPKAQDWQGYSYDACYNCLQCKPDDNGKKRNQPLFWARADKSKDEQPSSSTRVVVLDHKDDQDLHRLSSSMQWLAITPFTAPDDNRPPACETLHQWSETEGWTRMPMFSEGSEAANLRKFKNVSAHAWVVVQARKKKTYEFDWRDMTYKKHMSRLMEEHPGESRSKLRKSICRATLTLSVLILRSMGALDVTAGDSAEQTLREAAFEEADVAFQNASLDPEYRAQLASECLADDKIMQWVDRVCAGVWMFFCCRNPLCRCFMRAERWLWNGTSIYYCPMCFHKYQPWKDGKMSSGEQWVPAQKIMVMQDSEADATQVLGEQPDTATLHAHGVEKPSSSTRAGDPGSELPSSSTRAAGLEAGEKKDGYTFYLCEWPMTINADLINKLKAAATDVRSFCADSSNNMEKLEEKIVEFAAMMERVPFMQEQAVTKEIRDQVAYMNQHGGGHWNKNPLSYEHFPKNETGDPMVAFAKYSYTPGVTKVLTAEDQIRMWAFCAYQVAARKKLRELKAVKGGNK